MAKNWNETIQEMHKHEALEKAAAVLLPLDEARALIVQMREALKQENVTHFGELISTTKAITAAEAWLKVNP